MYKKYVDIYECIGICPIDLYRLFVYKYILMIRVDPEDEETTLRK